MHYEIDGSGEPLVFIHSALGIGGLEKVPSLSERHWLIMADLQGHGRRHDLPDRPLSIEQYAEDIVALLDFLEISTADIFGESYGGNAAVLMAIRYPKRVRRVAVYSATFSPAEIAHNPAMVRFDEPPTPASRDRAFSERATRRLLRTPAAGQRCGRRSPRFDGTAFRVRNPVAHAGLGYLPGEGR